jgi:hypothetical protein
MNKSTFFMLKKIVHGYTMIAEYYYPQPQNDGQNHYQNDFGYIAVGSYIGDSQVRRIAFSGKILSDMDIYAVASMEHELLEEYTGTTAETEQAGLIAYVLYRIFSDKAIMEKHAAALFKVMYEKKYQDYIVKQTRVQTGTDVTELREYVIYKLYDGHKLITEDSKHSQSLLRDAFLTKDNVSRIAVLVFRRNGLPADCAKYNYDEQTCLIFCVVAKLLILHQACFIYGNLTCDNVVFSQLGKCDAVIEFAGCKIKNSLCIYDDVELVNFSKAASFNEANKILEFIKLAVPTLYVRHKKLIEKLAEISTIDLAVAASALDALTFLRNIDARPDVQSFITANFSKYLAGNKSAALTGAGESFNSDCDILLAHQSIFTAAEFNGSEFEGGSNNDNDDNDKITEAAIFKAGTHNIELANLPLMATLKFISNVASIKKN